MSLWVHKLNIAPVLLSFYSIILLTVHGQFLCWPSGQNFTLTWGYIKDVNLSPTYIKMNDYWIGIRGKEDLMLVMKELLCSQSNEGLGSRNDHNLTFSSWLLRREVWVASIFIGVWLPASNLIHFSPLWKEGCSPGGFITGSAAETSHFIMADFSFSFQKKRQGSCGWSFPWQHRSSCFWKFISFLLYYEKIYPSGVLTRSSIDGSPCCLQGACLWGCFAPVLRRGKENNPLAKKSWNGGCFLWEGREKKKKNYAGPPRPKITPSF